jgi:hypothetical protein
MWVRSRLPEHHLSDDSRHLLEVSLGIIGTMSGLVLGLLVASATGSYNAQRSEVQDASSRIILLDHLLAHYGPPAEPARRALRATIQQTLVRIWPQEDAPGDTTQRLASIGGEAVLDRIADLAPKTDLQTSLKPQALGIVISLGQLRWLMFEQGTSSISMPLLVLLVFWFTITFIGFGLFAPSNATVLIALGLCALAVSGAIFIMLEMYTPFSGLLQIPSAPLREALSLLGR